MHDPETAAFLAAKKAHTERFNERFGVLVDRNRGFVYAFSNNPYVEIHPEHRENELAEVSRMFHLAGFSVAAVGRYPADGPDRGYTYTVAVEAVPEKAGLVLSLFDHARKNNFQNAWVRVVIHHLTISDARGVLPAAHQHAVQVLTPPRGATVITEDLFRRACRQVRVRTEPDQHEGRNAPLGPIFARAVVEVGNAALKFALEQLPEPVDAAAETAWLEKLTVLPTSALLLEYMLGRADGSLIPVRELQQLRSGG